MSYPIFAIVLVMLQWNCLHAQSQQPLEYQVKAAFLYNFLKFVEWPSKDLSGDQSSITLCVLGKDPFGAALDPVIGKTVGNRRIEVRLCKRIEDVGRCQILFISSSEQDQLPSIISALRNRSVLTVGDTVDFTQQGGIINFITQDNKVRFEINMDAAERANLKISSKLANLAKIVRDMKTKENP